MQRIDSTAQQINKHSADIVLLSEYWTGEKGVELQKHLREYGYVVNSNGEPKQNHLLFASRYPFEVLLSSYQREKNKEQWLEIKLTLQDLYILGIHIPVRINKESRNFG
ncbi:hypothetical protein [Peribacillus sp. TH27]|uniref:hypothetical protein n=1 Tax=Peribacillus sp. TH27 TaxID=2798484 RepID=UPI001F5B84E2|nr:hypothetical protein [Peribacillus sp. TH27]